MPVDVDPQALCVHVDASNPLSVTFPGGIKISAMIGVDKGDARATTQALLAYVNTALAPLTPLLNTIDLVVALKEVVTGDPSAIPTVLEKAAAVAAVPLAIPVMIKGILSVLVETVLALITDLEAIAAAQAEIAAAMTEAQQPGNDVLLATLECESGNLEVELQNQTASIGPLNSILGIVNAVLGSLIGQQIDPFGDVSDASAETLAALRASLDVVRQVASFLPG